MRASFPLFVLIHAPLVGPYTWALTAEAFDRLGCPAVCPALPAAYVPGVLIWQQQAAAVAQAVAQAAAAWGPASRPVILVAHSGAGPLLPAVRAALTEAPTAYILVDAGFPVGGQSRLDLFYDPAAADDFRRSAQAGLLPVWTDADLRDVIPDDAVRARFVSELRPLPLEVYEEPFPLIPGWPDAPGAYLRFGDNPAYDLAAGQAEAAGWPVVTLPGADHFHMLVEPETVARALVDLARRLGAAGFEEPPHA